MRIPKRAARSSGALLLTAVLLAGCSGPKHHADPTPTRSSSPAPTPIFTSDADALAAATDVYKKYERASDEIAHEGGDKPERVRPYVSDAGYQHEVDEANKYKVERAHGLGYTVLNNVVLQSRVEQGGFATVRVYVCEDISDVDLVDQTGKSLVSADRADYIAYVVELRSDMTRQLIIQSNTYWSGGGVCKA
ncbi:MAG TPA: hypothetical protein VGC45_10640 [Gryllotalpicola sp.]